MRLGTESGAIWDLIALDSNNQWTAYGRGVYRYVTGGENMSSNPEDDWILIYTGSRYFAAFFEDGKCKSREDWLHYTEEVHAFWDQVYTEKTFALSDPTSAATPIATDFFMIGRRGQKYGPFGELIPLSDPPGSGYFDCAMNASLSELVPEIVAAQESSRNCPSSNSSIEG